MENISYIYPPRPEKDMSACGLIGLINRDGKRVSGENIIRSLVSMTERGNGLGSGYAAYGIYPDYADHYALHVMFDNDDVISTLENFLQKKLAVTHGELIPIDESKGLVDHPFFKRYFVNPPKTKPDIIKDDDYIVRIVMEINTAIEGAYVVSSGKNMGVFKGVGFPQEIADFFRVHEYEGYLWTAHNRFPTNTPGWWGGAHPFTLLDCSVVHNGEISSYGINKRYLESFGYMCTLMTDTEVIAYLIDLLVRCHGLSLETACTVLAPPFWKDIDKMSEDKKEALTKLRMIYGSASLNGPFAFLYGFRAGLMGLNDRVKLRPLVTAHKGETVYISSEESAIRLVCPDVEGLSSPAAGEPVITYLNEEGRRRAQKC